MLRFLYQLIHFLIRYSGLSYLLRILFAKNGISIIMYHNPKPEYFKMHLEYLTKRYNLISFSSYLDALEKGRTKELPKYTLIITIDDGWKENYELLPLIKAFQIKPTIFLTADIINTDRHFWWTACPQTDIERLKKLPNNIKEKELRDKYKYDLQKEYTGGRQALNKEELDEMKAHVEFGLHTCTHPILTQCTSKKKVNEIQKCKLQVDEMLGLDVKIFSYPNGDYDMECMQILEESGVKAARTTDSGWNNRTKFNPYNLKVTGVSDHSSITKLAAELTGIPMFIQYVLQGSFSGKKRPITLESKTQMN